MILEQDPLGQVQKELRDIARKITDAQNELEGAIARGDKDYIKYWMTIAQY